MKIYIKICFWSLVAVLILALCSCSVFTYDNSRFEGGEKLDEELLSKIENDLKNDIETSEELDSEQVEESKIAETTFETESTSEKESDPKTNNGDATVYWVSGSEVWHTRRDCSHIRNSEDIISGTVAEAQASGGERLCKSCEKAQK